MRRTTPITATKTWNFAAAALLGGLMFAAGVAVSYPGIAHAQVSTEAPAKGPNDISGKPGTSPVGQPNASMQPSAAPRTGVVPPFNETGAPSRAPSSGAPGTGGSAGPTGNGGTMGGNACQGVAGTVPNGCVTTRPGG